MTSLRLRPVPAALFMVVLLVECVAVVLSWGLEPSYDTWLYFVYTVALAGAGTLIASRHPENPIGWLLIAAAILNAFLADAAQGWGLRAAAEGWPGGPTAEAVALASWIPQGPLLVATLVLFPTGRAIGRWGVLIVANVVGVLLALPGWLVSPHIGDLFVEGRNPLATDTVVSDPLLGVGLVLLLGSLFLAVVPVGLRLHRSSGIERQQLKWFAFAGICAAVVLPIAVSLWNVLPIVRPLVALALTALPIATCIAILRYRLYEIDIVISRTVVYTMLTVSLAATYGVTALVIGVIVGRRSGIAVAVATLAVAVAFRPLRDRFQDAVDRRFHRARYEAVHRVLAFLDELRAGRAAPEEIEEVLRSALGVDRLTLRFDGAGPGGCIVDVHGRPYREEARADQEEWPITRAGTALGTMVMCGVSDERRAMVPAVLDASVLAIEIAWLQVELRRQLDEVAASRARLVAVAEGERRRLERDLHDGAQQRLVSIGLALRHAQHAIGVDDSDASSTIDVAVAEIAVAIDELRELARGLRPGSLDGGLAPALRDLARRAPVPVDVRATDARFDADLETAAYFMACEGLTNAIKHARATRVVLIAHHERDRLIVTISDDGVGGARAEGGSGLTGLGDRIASHRGTLVIDSDKDGTTLTAELPCGS